MVFFLQILTLMIIDSICDFHFCKLIILILKIILFWGGKTTALELLISLCRFTLRQMYICLHLRFLLLFVQCVALIPYKYTKKSTKYYHWLTVTDCKCLHNISTSNQLKLEDNVDILFPDFSLKSSAVGHVWSRVFLNGLPILIQK